MPQIARHSGRVRPLVDSRGWVRVDGRPICAVCGNGIQLSGPNRWRHVPRGRRYTGRSKWLSPVRLDELRTIKTYQEFGARYPWAVRPDFGGPDVTSKEQWQEGVERLEHYGAALSEIGRRRQLASGENPYLDIVQILSAAPDDHANAGDLEGWSQLGNTGSLRGWAVPPGLYQMLSPSERRRELVSLFAWAIPSEEALTVIARYAPLVECGAGTGYWAALLGNRGVDVVAYDVRPPDKHARNEYHRGARQPWTEVVRGPSADAVRWHRDRVLFLCWPPLDDDSASYAPLRAYRGEVLVSVGEPGEGTTGTLRFQRELKLNWTLVEQVELPGWPWLRDCLMVYRRNPGRRPVTERDRCFECKRFIPTGAIGRCDWCFERHPPAITLKVGTQRLEYPEELLKSVPAAFRTALEQSSSRIR